MGLTLKNISKSSEGYKTLRDLDFTIEDSTFTAIVAPTGTGKTTLLRVMAGLEKPEKGSVIVDGKDVTNVHVRNRNVAMVYQQFINYPSLTVYENIASPLRVSRRPKQEIDQRVRAVADQLRIAELLPRLPQELSGGQQQRVAIARALVKDARMILFDEPLGNLDYKLREDLRVELKNLSAARSTIFVYATPEPIDALMMASQVGILHDGKIIQHGEMESVYRQPNHVKSGEYFSDPPMNFFYCEVRDNEAVITPEFRIPLAAMAADLAQGNYVLGIRAHHITVQSEGGTRVEGGITIEAKVELAEVVGSDITMHLSHQGIEFIALSHEFRHFDLDQRVMASFNPRQIHVFDVGSGRVVSSAAETR